MALFVVATTLVTVSSIETDFGPVINVLTVIAIEVILVGGMVMLYAAMILVAVAFQRHPGTLTEHTVTVDADGFTESTDVNETVTKWPGVTGVRRTPRYLFVYLGPATAHVIPCRAFATQEDFNRFSEMVIQHWRVHAANKRINSTRRSHRLS